MNYQKLNFFILSYIRMMKSGGKQLQSPFSPLFAITHTHTRILIILFLILIILFCF